MDTRPSPVNLIMSVLGFLAFMVLLLVVVGAAGGVGSTELLIWVALLVVGVTLIGVQFRSASRR
jgi:hypothetical protein